MLKLLCLFLLKKCRKLEEERDEAIKKLSEFQQGTSIFPDAIPTQDTHIIL